MALADEESSVIKQLTELNRELYLLEAGPGVSVFPMWGSSDPSRHLDQISDLKKRITDLEEILAHFDRVRG